MPPRDDLIAVSIIDSRGRATTVWRKPSPEIVNASYGATAFNGIGRTGDDISLSDPYYDSARHDDFMRSVYRNADDNDVDINSSQRALGVWRGVNEPSSAIEASGTREDIESVARGICKEFDQYAVRVIYRPGNGMNKLYSFDVGTRSPEIIMATLEEAGISGARITESYIELADESDLSDRALSTLESIYGRARVSSCEVVRIFGAD